MRKDSRKRKRLLKRIWNFIWYDDSLLSWAVNIILAFVLIKFLLYPGLGLVFGTDLPVVAVISGSMDHGGNFDNWWGETPVCSVEIPCPGNPLGTLKNGVTYCTSGIPCAYTQGEWYENHNISKELFQTYSFKNGFVRGDVISLKGIQPEDVEIGDVIVFEVGGLYPIIHRVVNKSNQGDEIVFTTKGDNNPHPIEKPTLNETHVLGSQLKGKATARIRYVGYVRLLAADLVSLFR